MAKLLKSAYPLPHYSNYVSKNGYVDYERWHKEAKEALDAIPTEKLFYYPVADGYAYYYIVSLSPLVLQHINYSDGWELPPAHIRGLRKEDILWFIDREKSWQKLLTK